MRRVGQGLVVAAMFCAACGMAAAQYESSDKSVIGIGYSFIKPSGAQLKRIRSTWTGPMLDINFMHDELDRPVGFVSIGWFGESGPTGRISFVPVKVSYIKRLSGGSRGGWYVGGGLDAYFAIYRGVEYSPYTRDYEYVDQKGVPVGVSLIAGIEFGGAWYGEMRYDIMNSLSLDTGSSVNFSGLSFVVGSRLAF